MVNKAVVFIHSTFDLPWLSLQKRRMRTFLQRLSRSFFRLFLCSRIQSGSGQQHLCAQRSEPFHRTVRTPDFVKNQRLCSTTRTLTFSPFSGPDRVPCGRPLVLFAPRVVNGQICPKGHCPWQVRSWLFNIMFSLRGAIDCSATKCKTIKYPTRIFNGNYKISVIATVSSKFDAPVQIRC